MPIKYHPDQGSILICDFKGFVAPEMVKRRPVIVISPRFRSRANLCTVIPLSTTEPRPAAGYHFELNLEQPLPSPYGATQMWAKADMICAVSFARLDLPFHGKDDKGNRIYDQRKLSGDQLQELLCCTLTGMGLHNLTQHLRAP